MSNTLTPTAASAAGRAYPGRDVTDPLEYTTYDSRVVSAKYFGEEVISEILGLWKAAVAGPSYSQLFSCPTTLNVGDPVYVSANNRVDLATSGGTSVNNVIGFVSSKPSTSSCYLDHFTLKT